MSDNNDIPRIIRMWEHVGWGDSIFWTNWTKRRVSGHLTPLPKDGDILFAKMESGKVAKLIFRKIETFYSPKDMFFATMEDNGYASDSELKLK